MSEILFAEWRLCLILAWTGMRLAAAYDVLRIFRRFVRHGRLWVDAEDILFGAAGGFAVFVCLLHVNDGRTRWYLLASLAAGTVLWRLGISPFVLRAAARMEKIVKICLKPLKSVEKKVTMDKNSNFRKGRRNRGGAQNKTWQKKKIQSKRRRAFRRGRCADFCGGDEFPHAGSGGDGP